MARGESFVSIKIEGLKEAMDALDPKNAQKATASALRQLTNQVKTEASSEIRNEYAIKKYDLDPQMKTRLPQWNNLTASITVSGKPISLMYFNARQLTAQNRIISRTRGKQLKRASRTLQQGVTYQVLKGNTKNLPHAFVQYDSRLKRLVVYYRKGKARNSIRSVNVVTIASLFANKKTMDAIQKKIDDKWPAIFKHELLRAMNKQTGS